jgi:hypothetical protein
MTTPVELCGEWDRRSSVGVTRNAGFNSLGGRYLSEGGAIIGFVANQARILWQALGEFFCQGDVGFVPIAEAKRITRSTLKRSKKKNVWPTSYVTFSQTRQDWRLQRC